MRQATGRAASDPAAAARDAAGSFGNAAQFPLSCRWWRCGAWLGTMTEDTVNRRLIAILVGDMAGYSRLMELDEPGTLARVKTHRQELIDPAIAKNKGRMVKTTGDG